MLFAHVAFDRVCVCVRARVFACTRRHARARTSRLCVIHAHTPYVARPLAWKFRYLPVEMSLGTAPRAL